MMVDHHVHFHFIPQYSKPIHVAGAVIEDAGWPRQPNMGAEADLSDGQMTEMLQSIKAIWPK
jgi:diadenosine tetraphosphate (Ap4A) HIT family hydrolase